MTSHALIQAIIWDYDGTLVDTREKNLSVTRKIIERVTGTESDDFEPLNSLTDYQIANRRRSNWREFYRMELHLTEAQIDEAGRLWTEYQLNDDTAAPFYEGIGETIRALETFPHGIVSQNSKDHITRSLDENRLLTHFDYIVGYEEVDLRRQKPEPDGLLRCIAALCKNESGCVCYIGDHETDAQCAIRANRQLKKEKRDLRVVSIGALYDAGPNPTGWRVRPGYEARRVEDILSIINQLNGSI